MIIGGSESVNSASRAMERFRLRLRRSGASLTAATFYSVSDQAPTVDSDEGQRLDPAGFRGGYESEAGVSRPGRH